MNLYTILESPSCARLFAALVHFVWQGLAIAAVASVSARLLCRHSARVRHGVYMAALVAMVLAVAVTYSVVDAPSPRPVGQAADELAAVGAVPAVGGEAAVTVSTEPVDVAALEPATRSGADADGSLPARLLGQARQATPYAVGVYLAGVVLMLGRLVLGLQGGGHLRRRSWPVDDPDILSALGRQARVLGLAFTPALAYCSRVLVPTVVGVLRPVILLPFTFASGLAAEQVEALLAHELAHIRRFDPLLNVVQRVIEAVLFFHPAVWFVSQRIRVEREHCCDDLVVGVSASASTYAASLVEAARRGLQGRATARLAPQGVGLADRPSRLRARIVRLLGRQVHERMRLRWTWLMGLVLAVSIGLVATVSLGGAADEDQKAAAGDATARGAADSGDTTAPKEAAPGGPDAILEMLTRRDDADAMLQVDLDLLLARIDRAVLDDVLEKVAPGSGDPSERPLVLSAEQREALDAALAELPEEAFQRRGAPRLRTGNRARASIKIVGKRGNEGDAEDAVGLSCAPVVSADRESIVLVLFSTTDKGKPAGSPHLGSGAVELPNTDDGGLMAAYRIANGGTLVLTGAPVHAPTSTAGVTPGPKAGAQPYVQLALVRARTVDDEAAAEEVSEARQRIIEKLSTRIPQIDFKDADLKEVIGYLGKKMDVTIVIDPVALAHLEQAGSKGTLSLNGMPFGEALKLLLKQVGLKYTVEDHALVVVPIADEAGDEGAVPPVVADEAAANERMSDKLNTRIPQVDFEDADLKEVVNYLCGEMDVSVVIDPAALPRLKEAGGKVTISLTNVTFGEALRFLLEQEGLKYTVEDDGIVIVPIDPGAGDQSAGETPLTAENLDEFETRTFRLLPGADRTAPDGERTQVEDMLLHGGAVTWPEGSSVAYDEPTKSLLVTNTRLNMAAIGEMIRLWNALEGGGGEGGHAEASTEAVGSSATAVGDAIAVEVRKAMGEDAAAEAAASEAVAAEAAAKEAAAARQRIIEKLNTRIPQLDLKNVDLKEVIDYLAREIDVNIVIDPTALAHLKDVGGRVTLGLKDVPFGEVLRYLLKQKGLKYTVEDNALVVVPIDEKAGEEGAVAPGVAQDAAALARIVKKLETRIPQLDFKDAPLKEVLSFLGREIDVNIVIDPAALARLKEAGDNVTLSLKDVPFGEALTFLLRQADLKYIVEANGIVVVPIGDEPAGEMKTEVFQLLVSGVRTIVLADGERREETIDEWLRRTEGVSWPAGSSVAYDKRAETLTVKNAPENMGAIYAKIRVWNRGAAETNPPGSRVIIQTVGSVGSEPAETPAGEKITTARFNLQGSGTRTVTDADGESRVETVDQWLRKAEGVTWPEGSRVVYDARIEMLTVSNTAENQAAIREKVKAWEAQEGADAADTPAEGVDEKGAD